MVSELCLGTMTFGREADEDVSRRLVERFLAADGNFIDTANVYSAGISEEITGRAIGRRREDVVLATKVRFEMGDKPNDVGLSRKHVLRACDESLRRLGTDYIDIYQLHCWDRVTPIEETFSALADLVASGKVRYVGLSNFTGWQVMDVISTCHRLGYPCPISLQPQYSLIERHIEREVVPACLRAGLGLIPWGPLGQGFLTGKYRRDEQPSPGTRLEEATEDLEEHWSKRSTERNWRTLDVLLEVADRAGKTPSQVALNWLLQKDGVTAPIVGARTEDQLEDNLGVPDWDLDPDDVSALDEVSRLEPIYPYGFIAEAQRTA